jgi:amino-acid N-acetyltransferase
MVIIRKATVADDREVRGILLEAALPTDDFSDGEMVFLVAEEDGAIVGTIGLELYPPAGLLRSAAVRTAHRGRGVAALLVEALMREARERSLAEVVLLTTTAEGYFRRLGFSSVARETLSGPVLSSRQFTGTTCASAAVMRIALR